MLKLEKVSKSFGGVQAVRDVSFSVDRGSLVGLMGPNGAGKSTLFALISGFLPADKGEIRYQGIDTSSRTPDALARAGLVRTFQMCAPFGDLTVWDNVLVGALRCNPARIQAERIAASAIDLTGLDFELSAPASELGVPQRKRLELARALAVSPQVLLCDELMGGLMPSEQAELAQVMLRIRERGITLVVVEHAVAILASIADEMVALVEGRVAKIGPPEQVLADPVVIEAYFGAGRDE